MNFKFIAYYRVSTKRQGESGLGLHAQKDAVNKYICGRGELIAEYTEIETGTRKRKRTEIYKAIDLAQKEKAILVVGKLDRLSRDVEFTSALYNSGVEFICCDNPSANKLTIQLLSVIAENEAEMISKRIKEALKVKKDKLAKGIVINSNGTCMKPINNVFRLGNPNGFGNYQKLGIEKIKENARNNKANIQALHIICIARKEGQSYQKIADKLNELQYRTRNGKKYTAMQVLRLSHTCNN